MFDKNGRVEHVKNGLRFYEQDIVMCSYIFSEKRVVVDVALDYVAAGFGIVINEAGANGSTDEAITYLAKVGVDSFQVFRRRVKNTPECLHTEACSFSPGDGQRRLRFTIRRTKITLEVLNNNTYTKLGEYALPDQLYTYQIGIYSSARNTLESMTFLVNMPSTWVANVANTFGGRISFKLDGFSFENCQHDAEIEQDRVSLKAGKYYLRYNTAEVNGKNDIQCYVFKSTPQSKDESEIEDEHKQLLMENNIFLLDEPAEVSVKFKGTNGTVSNVYLTELAGGSYVRTYQEPESHKGSVITALLNDAVSVEWVGIVSAIPDWNDMSKPCPYSIAAVGKKALTKDEAGITLGVRYKFSYDVASGTLSTYEGVNFNSRVKLPNNSKDNVLSIFQGVSGVITSLILTTKNNKTIDALISQSTKVYVPQSIKSPIIVMSDENGPYDLSSSYREVVIPHKRVEVFGKNRPLELEERIVTSIHAPHVYGIPEGSKIDQTANTIEAVCKDATEIPAISYSFERNVLSLDKKVRARFSHIAVEYDSIKDYYYWFTNTEREVFSGDELKFSLAMPMRHSNNAVAIYGIAHEADIEDEMFYRVPNKGMLHSIDTYANKYETISHSLYDIYFDSNYIELDRSLKGKYKQYIVEYEKRASYCVNLMSDMGEYEVAFISEGDTPYVIYDQHDDGSISTYINTDIQPDKNKYIVLRRKEG